MAAPSGAPSQQHLFLSATTSCNWSSKDVLLKTFWSVSAPTHPISRHLRPATVGDKWPGGGASTSMDADAKERSRGGCFSFIESFLEGHTIHVISRSSLSRNPSRFFFITISEKKGNQGRRLKLVFPQQNSINANVVYSTQRLSC